MSGRPVIVTAAMAPADHAWATALRRRHFPPERNRLDAHLTLFHHLSPAALPEIGTALAAEAAEGAPEAEIDRLLNLGRGVALHVRSPGLSAMRARLANRFHGLLTPQDRQKPRLHVTIQNKVEPAAARALIAELEPGFRPRPLRLAGLAMWYYDGGPWEAIATVPFRVRRAP